MQITVKSAKILKTGTNDKGQWRLAGVTSDQDVNYATFASGAENLAAGMIIDIGEPTEKDGKWNFKEYKIVKAAPIKMATSPKLNISDNSRDRSIAFSYVKDMVCALINAGVLKKVDREELMYMFTRAEMIANWMNGEFIVEPPKKKKELEEDIHY